MTTRSGYLLHNVINVDSLRMLTLHFHGDEPSSKHLVRLFRDGAKFSGKHEFYISNRGSPKIPAVSIEVNTYALARLSAILEAAWLVPAAENQAAPTNQLRQLIIETADDEIILSQACDGEQWLIKLAGALYCATTDLPGHGYSYLERECLSQDPSAFFKAGESSRSAIALHSDYEIRTRFGTIVVRVGENNPALLALENHHRSESSALFALGSMRTVESACMKIGYQFAGSIQTNFNAAWYEARVLPLGLENTIERRFAIFITGNNIDPAQLQKLMRPEWALFGSRGTLRLLKLLPK